MNILIDLLPTIINIDNKEYDINSDFRTSILFELLMQDKSILEEEKIIMALNLYYPVIPNNINLAIEKMLWFYRCGKDVKISKSNSNGRSNNITQIYSYEYDDDYIYSAFLDQYRIDLQDIEDLHWWKFKAMFKSLREGNEIVKIMGYRSMDLSKVKDKEQKGHYKKMKELFKIPLSKDEQEKLEEIEKALLDGKGLNRLL